MVFWALLVIFLIGLFVIAYMEYKTYGKLKFEFVFLLLATCVLGTCALALILYGVGDAARRLGVETEKVDTTSTQNLKEVSTGQESFFLLSGFVEDEHAFVYAYEQDGWTHLGTAPDNQSRVSETVSADEAYLDITETKHYYHWLLPFSVGQTSSYEFYVPEGTIVETYSTTAEGTV